MNLPYCPGFIYAAYASDDTSEETTITAYTSMPMFLADYIHVYDVSSRGSQVPEKNNTCIKEMSIAADPERMERQEIILKSGLERKDVESNIQQGSMSMVSPTISEILKANNLADFKTIEDGISQGQEDKRKDYEERAKQKENMTKGEHIGVSRKIFEDENVENTAYHERVKDAVSKNTDVEFQPELEKEDIENEATDNRGNQFKSKVTNNKETKAKYTPNHNNKEADWSMFVENSYRHDLKTRMKPVGFPFKEDPPATTLTAIEMSKSRKLKISSQKFPCYIPKARTKVILIYVLHY